MFYGSDDDEDAESKNEDSKSYITKLNKRIENLVDALKQSDQ